MNSRSAARRILGLIGVTSLIGASACGPRADDINQVHPGYVKKALFQTDDEFYVRRTVVQSETLNLYAIEGSGDLWLDRVKFKVTQDLLIAYKPYENIPGAERAELPGAEDVEGVVLAAFPITSHFDIIRSYDEATGTPTNVISENTSDRVWSDREFMRIDWATNVIDGGPWGSFGGWGVYETPITILDSGKVSVYQDEAPTDPYGIRVTDDYIDVTVKHFLGMDIYACAYFSGFSYDNFTKCGFGEAKVRTSFVRIKEKSDFIPRNYPDSIVKKDANGNAQYDEETGEVLREPIYDRFGIFRLELPTYDRGYGYTESGRLFRAMIHNIWEKHTDGNGNPLAYAARTPKPVIYYLNSEYPTRWNKAAKEVGEDYNQIFRKMVADLQGKPLDQVPTMFEIRDNDCNIANVKSFVSNNPDLEFAVSRAVCRDGEACTGYMDKIGIGNLERVCSSLEAATRVATETPKFDWQRIGDARFKMVVWLSNPQDSGWGGYGPMHADARTGESVSATAFLRGWAYELAASNIVDYIEFINDEKSVEDVIWGQDVRAEIAPKTRQFLEQLRDRKNRLASTTAGAGLVSRLNHRINELGATRGERLREIDPNAELQRLRRAEGTRLMDALVTKEDMELISGGQWRADRDGAPSRELIEAASPLSKVTRMNPFNFARDRGRRMLTNAGFCFLKADFDPHWVGLALDLKDVKDRAKRYEIVGTRTIKHVLAHELGHNMGLSHNFEGSYDALNYPGDFWTLNNAGTDGEPSDAKREGNYDELRNTTVMEYMSAKGMYYDKLGSYDEAALRFAYGEQVQVFNDTNMVGGRALKNWRMQNDYLSIPEHVCAGCTPDEKRAKLADRKWVKFDEENPPANEVPYLFCDNAYDRRTPFCATFDYGSNLREIHGNYHEMWSSYFYFNNFIRDRIVPQNWDPFNALTPATLAFIQVNLVNQYLYYYASLDPSFLNSELGKDMAASVAAGLNMAAEVLSTPEPIRACAMPNLTPDVYIPGYYFDGGVCDDQTPLNSDKARTEKQIQIPLGPGRPAGIGFTDDSIDYDISFMGSYFDKDRVLMMLGMTRPRVFRFNYDLDTRNYQVSLFRLFEPEIRSLMDRMITLDTSPVTFASITDTARSLGSFWCRDPANPDMASQGYFAPRPMIDPVTGKTWPVEPPAEMECMNPGVVYPTLLRNMPLSAMFWAHVLFSSDFDTELDVGKSMKVYVVGADDEISAWRNLPANELCSVVDVGTGLEYRAVRQPDACDKIAPTDGCIPDIGCRLIEQAREAQRVWESDRQNDFLKERSRAWFERLEYARDLSRVYNP
jgi:hypothetical protein